MAAPQPDRPDGTAPSAARDRPGPAEQPVDLMDALLESLDEARTRCRTSS